MRLDGAGKMRPVQNVSLREYAQLIVKVRASQERYFTCGVRAG
jgi:hypothetical protein